jgi:hypothetical protein
LAEDIVIQVAAASNYRPRLSMLDNPAMAEARSEMAGLSHWVRLKKPDHPFFPMEISRQHLGSRDLSFVRS